MHDFSRAIWRKSRRSGGDNNCVEVTRVPGVIGVRDSKNPSGAPIVLAASQWRAFVGLVEAGGYDL